MATFELHSDMLNTQGRKAPSERFERSSPRCEDPCCGGGVDGAASLGSIKQESVLTLKIYDSCRHQDCLDADEIGACRSARDQVLNGKQYKEGEVITTPDNCASVSADDLRVKKIIIVSKRPNPFRRGFWDIELKYVFDYCLELREACGKEIGYLRGTSCFNKQCTLFGSIGSDIVISTDLFRDGDGDSPTLSLDPFVLSEAKGVALSAKLRHLRPCDCDGADEARPAEVIITIGLFTIVKLFRIVTLLVESRGFSIPPLSEDCAPVNVCEFFERQPFPMDVFSPPQRREFEAGITGDIPSERCGGGADQGCCD